MNPALFLDRDGIINIDHGYVHKPEDFTFMPGIFDLCRTAIALGRRIHVVTNQAGIARGYYSEDDFARLTDWMKGVFANEDAPLEAVHYCPFHPDHGVPPYNKASSRRKPAPGMLLDAAAEWGLDLRCSALIGDQVSDILAANAAGLPHALLMPRNEEEKGKAVIIEKPPIMVSSLHEAVAALRQLW